MQNTAVAINDCTTLQRIREGDERVLSSLYHSYYPKLHYYGMLHLNDSFSVSSIIHESFIKAWNYRAHIQRPEHFYFLIRTHMKWHFQKYYGNARYRFYRATFLTEHPEERFKDIPSSGYEESAAEISEERLESIYSVIPLLPMNKSTVMLLHFKYGLSYKAIARRVGSTNKKVMADLQKSVKSIKAMLSVKAAASTESKINNSLQTCLNTTAPDTPLTTETLLLLRTEQKLSFEDIAARYRMERGTVISMYLEGLKTARAV